MKKQIKAKLCLFMALAVILTVFPCRKAEAAAPKLNKKNATIYVGNTVTLKLQNAWGVKWRSSNTRVATVSSSGVVTGHEVGQAKITATYRGKGYVATVTVRESRLTRTELTLYTGYRHQLGLKNTDKKASWKSSNAGVARVNSSGVVTAQRVGQAVITATVGSVKYNCTVKVVAPLRDRDFDYINANQYGYKNYIDMVLGRGSDWYRTYDSKGLESENRGVGIGAGYADVVRAFGLEKVVKVSANDSFRSKFKSSGYPLTAMRYTYKERGVEYYKKFYFDRYNRLSLIIWYNNKSWDK